MLVFDIETGPLSDEHLAAICPPFEPPPHPGEFDPASVKYGNLKDEAKRAEKLEEARTTHERAVKHYEADCESLRVGHFLAFRNKAALSPLTGEVVAIGYQSEKGFAIDGQEEGNTEADILEAFWGQYENIKRKSAKLIGWNIGNFDLQFILLRSWKLGVEIPSEAWNFRGRWFNWDDRIFLDLMLVFSCGGKFVKLDEAASFLSLGAKNGNGADFARLWRGTQEERAQAEAYLQNDLQMTAEVARAIGIR